MSSKKVAICVFWFSKWTFFSHWSICLIIQKRIFEASDVLSVDFIVFGGNASVFFCFEDF